MELLIKLIIITKLIVYKPKFYQKKSFDTLIIKGYYDNALKREVNKIKTNRELIYEFIKHYDFKLSGEGLTTATIADKLNMQRSNVSSILNQLVDEKLLEKTKTRPVIYYLKEHKLNIEDVDVFTNLIGYQESLQTAVNSAKAAILYPMGSLHCAVVGAAGVGTSYFVELMYLYSVEKNVQKSKKSIIKFNCRNYINEPEELMHKLFGPSNENFTNIMDQSKGGFLFLDNIEELPPQGRNLLISILKNKEYTVYGSDEVVYVDNAIILGVSSRAYGMENILSNITIVIRLSELSKRSFKERLELINHFFALESIQTKKTLKISNEVMLCLLLYRCNGNVKQLQNDIRTACANAYVREYGSESDKIQVYLSNFEHYVREGFLEYKHKRNDLAAIIPFEKNYIYEGSNVRKTESLKYELNNQGVYDYLDTRIESLQSDGLKEREINTIMSQDIMNVVNQYTDKLDYQMDTTKINKIVPSNIVSEVEAFLEEAKQRFNKQYGDRVFYGICLYLNDLINKSSENIYKFDDLSKALINYKEEYSFCLSYASKFETSLNISLAVEEIMMLTVFITQKDNTSTTSYKTPVIVAMHGSSSAKSIVEVVKSLVQSDNIYAYDLAMNMDPLQAYTELSQLMLSVNNGNGFILAYDMGSFEAMGTMFAQEHKVEVELIQIQTTLLVLDIVRKTAIHNNLREIHRSTIKNMEAINKKNMKNIKEKQVVVTLCETSQGGALHLKKYLESNDIDNYYKIVNVAMDSNFNINDVVKDMEVKAIIGSFDPKIPDITFITINEVFSTNKEGILNLIDGNEYQEITDDNMNQMKLYLSEQIQSYDINELEPLLLFALDSFSSINSNFNKQQQLGVFVHIASVINRNLENQKIPICLKKDMIMQNYSDAFKKVSALMKPIEEKFKIIISDDEMATIVSLILKI